MKIILTTLFALAFTSSTFCQWGGRDHNDVGPNPPDFTEALDMPHFQFPGGTAGTDGLGNAGGGSLNGGDAQPATDGGGGKMEVTGSADLFARGGKGGDGAGGGHGADAMEKGGEGGNAVKGGNGGTIELTVENGKGIAMGGNGGNGGNGGDGIDDPQTTASPQIGRAHV